MSRTALPVEMPNQVLHGENLDVLSDFEDASFDLIYVDPPFNTNAQELSG